MKILIAQPHGMCTGVARALRIALEALNERPGETLWCFHELVHNEHVVNALRENSISSFRKRYRNTDVLLIDDIQFFAGKERCQEEFFHTFNELFNSSKQIVLSCDKPINEVSDIEQRLVSRFGWGLSADIQAPDYETRLAILHNKLADMPEGVEIHPEVLDLLARKFTKNIRRMEGALNNLIGYATLLKTISLEKAQQLLADALMQEDETQSIDIEDIQKKTADYFDKNTSGNDSVDEETPPEGGDGDSSTEPEEPDAEGSITDVLYSAAKTAVSAAAWGII